MGTVRNRFSARREVLARTTGVDRTKQSFKDQSDINHIMGRYLRSGNVDWLSRHQGAYGVFEPQTFQDCMNIVAKAKEMFADLPAAVRKRFGHDPREFVAFSADAKNLDELRKLGLAKPAETSPAASGSSSPTPAPIAAPAPPGAPTQ